MIAFRCVACDAPGDCPDHGRERPVPFIPDPNAEPPF